METLRFRWSEIKKEADRQGVSMADYVYDTIDSIQNLGYFVAVEDDDEGITLYCE